MFGKEYFLPVGWDLSFHMNEQLIKEKFQMGEKLRCLHRIF